MILSALAGHAHHYETSTATYARALGSPAEQVMGEPHHILVPGYQTTTVNFSLWRAKLPPESDFRLFDIGDYASAVEHKARSETIRCVSPTTTRRRAKLCLRLATSWPARSTTSSLRFLRCGNHRRPGLVSRIQLNDTHPSVVAILELDAPVDRRVRSPVAGRKASPDTRCLHATPGCPKR